MKRIAILSTFLLATLSMARAHAFLDHAEPRVGSTLQSPPAQVKLWMTEDLEPAFTRVQVFDEKGTEVDQKDDTIDGSTMRVSLPPLPPGTYKVAWKAVATDTHHTAGTFTFTVH